jgi:hypothetical protein
MPFEIVQVACEKHPDQWNVAGSLLSGPDNVEYATLLSTLALKREFVIHHNLWKARRDLPNHQKAVSTELQPPQPLPT